MTTETEAKTKKAKAPSKNGKVKVTKAATKKAAKPKAGKAPKAPKAPKEKKEKKVNPLSPARTLGRGETVKCAVTGETVSDAIFVGNSGISLPAARAIRGQLRKRQREARKAK